MFCHCLVSLDLNIFTVVLVTVSVLSLFQLSNKIINWCASLPHNTLSKQKLGRKEVEVCCTWNLYGWPRICVAWDGLNIGLLHMGHVLLMLTMSNPCSTIFDIISGCIIGYGIEINGKKSKVVCITGVKKERRYNIDGC